MEPQDDDEFVVPHMDISCLKNSIAYQRVLEEPWTYMHNWNSLAPTVQQEIVQNFLDELNVLKSEVAVTQGLIPIQSQSLPNLNEDLVVHILADSMYLSWLDLCSNRGCTLYSDVMGCSMDRGKDTESYEKSNEVDTVLTS